MQKNSLREPENETGGQQSRALPSRPGHTAKPRVALFFIAFFICRFHQSIVQ